jgi:hypothetical protein
VVLVAAIGWASACGVEFASAQNYPPLVHPGARVRVFVADTTHTAKSDHLIATLVDFRDDAIVLRRESHGVASELPLAQIRRLEVSEGRKSKSGSGARIGLIAGIGGGIGAAFIACADGGCEEAEGGNDYTGLVAAAFGLGGGLVGAGLGAVTGSFFHSEDWVAVPLPNARLGLRPSGRDGVRIALTLPFDPRLPSHPPNHEAR